MADGVDGVTLVLKKSQRLLFALVSLALSSTLASAQPPEVLRNEITLRGTVEAVDHDTRTVRIRGEQGNVVTLDVPQSVARFDQVKVGDIVTASYFDVVSVRPKPAGEAAVDRYLPPITSPTPGTLPGAVKASQRVTTVTITSWDPATRVVTFTGPSGTSYTRHLLETDVSLMEGLKVGDSADVTRTESATFSFRERHGGAGDPAGSPPPDDFRHRLTISALFGVDNSFSGNMIKAATGATTGGVPINLNETKYDDVYGRMGMFRFGAGYRETPRTESVFNFILSRSSAQTVNVGTVGGTPLDVNFTDFNYWGVEGGQRVFFARTRFTPYVGYLVGINRNGDIRGTFVGPFPRSRRPASRHKTGSSSRSPGRFSLGPTARIPHRPWPHRVDGRDAAALAWAVCRMSIGSSRRACATSTARARGGRSRSRSARGFGSDISDDEASDHEAWHFSRSSRLFSRAGMRIADRSGTAAV